MIYDFVEAFSLRFRKLILETYPKANIVRSEADDVRKFGNEIFLFSVNTVDYAETIAGKDVALDLTISAFFPYSNDGYSDMFRISEIDSMVAYVEKIRDDINEIDCFVSLLSNTCAFSEREAFKKNRYVADFNFAVSLTERTNTDEIKG